MSQARLAPFDGMAQGYDAGFTATALGSALRAMTWQRFEHNFAGRESLLEIGCGTGADAIHLARNGHRVLATDASAQMVEIAREKAERAGVASRIRFLCVPMEQLGDELADEAFDGVYSNFGAVNCTARIDRLVVDIAPRMKAGAPLVWVVMGRFVPWEWAWFLVRGDAHKAFRRLNRRGVEWRNLTVSYPTPAALGRALRPHFAPRGARSLGFALPPSYAGAWLDSSPRALAALTRIERAAQSLPGCATFADHYILEAQRESGEPSHVAG